MNLASLRATFTRNKMPLAAAGALLVVALAWRARTSAKINAAGTTPTAAAAGTSATGTTAAGGTSYDSTASDVYNAIQPQLEQLQQMASQIPVPGTPTSPASTPAEASAYEGKYVRNAGTGLIAHVVDGHLYGVPNLTEYAQLGNPIATNLPSEDPIWKG
jgi:hypothetical protein